MTDCVSFKALGTMQVMRLTTGAGRRLERVTGVPFIELSKSFEERAGFELLAQFFAATLNDGKGAEEAVAEDVIDALGGLTAAAEIMGNCIKAAMPEADDDAEPDAAEGTEGNANGEG